MAFLSLGLAAGAAAGLAIETSNVRIKTFVVPIDSVGRPGRIEAIDGAYRPTSAETAYFVGEFVRDVRARSVDPDVIRDAWLRAYGLVAGDAASALDAYAKSEDPMKRVGEEAVNVEIAAILPRSNRTFEVNWRESRIDRSGRKIDSRWTGVFTTESTPPKDEAELRANPLGIRVINFQWSREL